MKRTRKYGKFTPISNRPVLPLSDNDRGATEQDPLGMRQYHYKGIAWAAYWKMVHQTAKKHKLRLWAAHQKLQKNHPIQVPDMGDRDYVWSGDDFLLLFMWQFEKWQIKTYDMDKIYDEGNDLKHMVRIMSHRRVEQINAQTSLEDAFELHDDDVRYDFVNNLWCRGHKHILEQIVDDPIFGHNAKFELASMGFSQQHAIDELFRRAALPDNIIKVDQISSKCWPSLYSVHFPYPPNQYHNVSNCLCMLADGGPIFRLEVLDPPLCSRFKLAELMSPWWSLNGRIGEHPGPGEGEYDFPFYDLDIVEGQEFDIDKLIEVMELGANQIAARGDRKWGKSA